ncbi:MAG: gamma-butyrobetaine hydroxylase-like domain-containing protein [Porticoccaceae bacterium]
MNKPLDNSLVPSRLVLNKRKDCLSLEYAGDIRHQLPAEYLRVLSPSAEVRGHGRGQEVLQTGKRNVLISAIAKSGNYAIQISFTDGHDSGIYSWDYLYELGSNYESKWADYLQSLQQAGQTRDPDTQVVKLV